MHVLVIFGCVINYLSLADQQNKHCSSHKVSELWFRLRVSRGAVEKFQGCSHPRAWLGLEGLLPRWLLTWLVGAFWGSTPQGVLCRKPECPHMSAGSPRVSSPRECKRGSGKPKCLLWSKILNSDVSPTPPPPHLLILFLGRGPENPALIQGEED